MGFCNNMANYFSYKTMGGTVMSPEEKSRLIIDEKLKQCGWVLQSMKELKALIQIHMLKNHN